jgi:hypothetical protein
MKLVSLRRELRSYCLNRSRINKIVPSRSVTFGHQRSHAPLRDSAWCLGAGFPVSAQAVGSELGGF